MAEQDTKLSKSVIVSLAFIGLLVVAAAVILLWPRGSDTDAAAPETRASPSATTQDAEQLAGIEPSACGLASDADMTMDTPPEQVEAITVGLVKVPSSEIFGPVEQANEVPICWQYSQAGAVSAAYTFAATATETARLTEGHLIEHLADGPGRDEMLDQLDQLKDSPEKMGTMSAPIKPVGYRVLEFADGQARIDVLLEHLETPGHYAAIAEHLVWQDGDWKLDVTETGDNYSEMRQVPDTADFTMWEIE